jgi:CTP-dependent riboflavin kinase
VHSLVDCSIALIGADMHLSDVKKALNETEDIRLAGSNMKGMGHGLAYWHNRMGYIFLETDMAKIDAIHLKRGI